MNRSPLQVRDFDGLWEMSGAVAVEAGRILYERVHERGLATVVLAGGTTPRLLYEHLAGEPYRSDLPWESLHLFWGDERFVPADDPASNYRMVRETLFDHVAIPPENIHPIDTSCDTPDEAADIYEQMLRFFMTDHRAESSFDLVLLGVGHDGHTASLFPGDDALGESDRWVVPVTAPPGVTPSERITLTIPILDGARHVMLLAAWPGKEHVLEALSAGDRTIPAGMIGGHVSTDLYIADNP